MQEGTRAIGNGLDDSFGGDDGAKRGVTARQSFSRDQYVGPYVPMVDREVAPGATHASHYFIRNEEQALALADFCYGLQIHGWRDDCSESSPADRLKDKSGGFTGGEFNGTFKLRGILLSAVPATIGAVEGAAIAIRHPDVWK